MTWTSTADGVLVWTDETFCSDWPDAGRSCPCFRAACIYSSPLEVKNTNLRSANSGTVVLLWPPAEPPALLEAAKRDICVTDLFAVNDWAIAAAALLLKEKLNFWETLLFVSCKTFQEKIDTIHICMLSTTPIPKSWVTVWNIIKNRLQSSANKLFRSFVAFVPTCLKHVAGIKIRIHVYLQKSIKLIR